MGEELRDVPGVELGEREGVGGAVKTSIRSVSSVVKLEGSTGEVGSDSDRERAERPADDWD